MEHTDKYKGCVVIQGPTYENSLEFIRRCWSGYKLVFSTWEGANLGNFLQDETVILSQIPEDKGTLNTNLQKISTINGMLHAKKLGWKRAFKWRCDMIYYGTEFLNRFDNDNLNVFAWCHNYGGHVTDYFFEGEVDDILSLYDFEAIDGTFPEYMVTQKLYQSGLNKKVNVVGKHFGYDTDIFWHGNDVRPSMWLSSYKNVPATYAFDVPKVWPNI